MKCEKMAILRSLSKCHSRLTPFIAKNLEKFPELGRQVPEAEERGDVRELIFQGYRIIYLHQTAHVYIAAVTHGSRDLIGMENRPWEVS